MVTVLYSIVLGGLGLVFGSFAGAQMWRLRANQLVEDKREGYEYDKGELKQLAPLLQKNLTRDRSQCLSCHHTLGLRDLIPLLSWLSTGGRCRYCKTSIGYLEPLIELGTAGMFVLSYIHWPFGEIRGGTSLVLFGLWLIGLVCLAILVAYDSKWKLLPDKITYVFTFVAAFFLLTRVVSGQAVDAWSVAGSLAILSGLYGVLHVFSKGSWIGLGDVKLGVGLALFLADWKLAFVALFLANLIGCFVVVPGIMSKRLTRQSQVPFGPFLVIGMVISFLYGSTIVEWILF